MAVGCSYRGCLWSHDSYYCSDWVQVCTIYRIDDCRFPYNYCNYFPCIAIIIIAIPIIAIGVAMIGWVGGIGGRLGRVHAPAPLFYVSINWHVANNWLSNNENSKSRYHALLLTSTYCIIGCLWGMVSMYDESALLVLYWLYIILDSFRV